MDAVKSCLFLICIEEWEHTWDSIQTNDRNNVIEVSFNIHFLFFQGMPVFHGVNTLFGILLFF